MAKLIGTGPNQVPTNADLGSMAFEDKKNYATTSSPIYQPYRNLIINGDMSIAQRGTSQASAGSSGGSYDTIDRYKFFNGNLGTFTMSQDTDVPTGQGFVKSLKLDCTAADASPAAGDFLIMTQGFEGQNLQYLKKGTSSAESLTASFWVKSNKTGTYICELRDIDNTRHISKLYTIDTANTWEKKTLTFVGDTSGALDNDNNGSFFIQFWLGAGSNFNSGTLQTSWGASVSANRAVGQVNLADSTANEWYVTGVQLEAGTTASDFEFLPVDVNLQRCFRYYEAIIANNVRGISGIKGNSTGLNVFFKEKKRAVPTMSDVTLRNGTNDNSTTVSASTSNWTCEDYARYPTTATTGSVGDGVHIYNANGKITADAEL